MIHAERTRVPRRSLLVVDDDSNIREILDTMLRREGFDVMTCENGSDALALLRTPSRPDIILLDLMMPIMDGWQFRVEQRRDPDLARIPVIALSADDTAKAAAIDAEAYLQKPVDSEALLRTLERLSLVLERRELAARLTQTDRLASLGTLAAGVAHEINNPLAYVLLNVAFAAEQLPRICEPSERRAQLEAALDHAREGVDRIRGIVRGLKAFSRPEDESRGPVHVRPVIESSMGMIANELRYRATVVTNWRDVSPVVANTAQLGQVFLNLLMNAVQALPEGRPGPSQITIDMEEIDTGASRAVVVRIADTGVGIPPEIRARIFEPFFTTKPVGVGTGLGLAISHGIVTSFGGKLTVESELGNGSVFRVELPVAVAPAPVSAEVLSPGNGGRRGRILVIDDEPKIGITLKRVLGGQHDVVPLAGAREALALLADDPRFDVILCDLMMPGLDGVGFFETLVATAPDLASRVVFITGGAFAPRAVAFLATVPNRVIEKPVDVRALRTLVDELVARRALT